MEAIKQLINYIKSKNPKCAEDGDYVFTLLWLIVEMNDDRRLSESACIGCYENLLPPELINIHLNERESECVLEDLLSIFLGLEYPNPSFIAILGKSYRRVSLPILLKVITEKRLSEIEQEYFIRAFGRMIPAHWDSLEYREYFAETIGASQVIQTLETWTTSANEFVSEAAREFLRDIERGYVI